MKARVEKHYIKNTMSFVFRDYSETNKTNRLAKKITTIDNIKKAVDKNVKEYAISRLDLEETLKIPDYDNILTAQQRNSPRQNLFTVTPDTSISFKYQITVGDMSCTLYGSKQEVALTIQKMRGLLYSNKMDNIQELFDAINNRIQPDAIQLALKDFSSIGEVMMHELSIFVYCTIDHHKNMPTLTTINTEVMRAHLAASIAFIYHASYHDCADCVISADGKTIAVSIINADALKRTVVYNTKDFRPIELQENNT